MCFLSIHKEMNEMKKKLNNPKTGKKSIKGILLSVLFTAVVPIGFVFLMGLLSETMPILYSYTKQIFIGFVVLLLAGLTMIAHQLYCYIKENNQPQKTNLQRRREQRNLEKVHSSLEQG